MQSPRTLSRSVHKTFAEYGTVRFFKLALILEGESEKIIATEFKLQEKHLL